MYICIINNAIINFLTPAVTQAGIKNREVGREEKMADLKKMFIYADKSVFVTQSQGIFNACPENIEKWQRDLPVDKTLDCTPTQFEAVASFQEEYMEFSHTSNKGMMKSENHYVPCIFEAQLGQRFLSEEIPMQWKRKFGQNHLAGLREYFKVIPI